MSVGTLALKEDMKEPLKCLSFAPLSAKFYFIFLFTTLLQKIPLLCQLAKEWKVGLVGRRKRSRTAGRESLSLSYLRSKSLSQYTATPFT